MPEDDPEVEAGMLKEEVIEALRDRIGELLGGVTDWRKRTFRLAAIAQVVILEYCEQYDNTEQRRKALVELLRGISLNLQVLHGDTISFQVSTRA